MSSPPQSTRASFGQIIPLLALVWCVTGCDILPALLYPPPTKIDAPLVVSTRTPAAQQATTEFWAKLLGNQTEDLPEVIDALTAAYDADPDDPVLARFLGYAYAWMGLERNRVPNTDDLDPIATVRLAEDLLLKAQALDPTSRVAVGFGTAMTLTRGIFEDDPELFEKGYQQLLDNTAADPNFHGFIQGWAVSAMISPDDPRYADAYAGHYATLDACLGFNIPRDNLSPPPFIFGLLAQRAMATDTGCYNTDIVPHNIEATFLAIGDMYLKDSQIDRAAEAYEAVKTLPSYETWKFQDVLDERLNNLEALSEKFKVDSGKFLGVIEPAMSLQSQIACTSCHAQ